MANYIRAAEGFDIYPAGGMVTDFPWVVMNPSYNATIVNSSGAFGGNRLRMSAATSTVVSGTEYQFQSTTRMRRSDVSFGSQALLSFNAWVRVDAASTTGTFNLVSFGTDTTTSQHQMMVGLNVSPSTGVSLMFARNITTPTSNPILFNIELGQWYWVTVTYGWTSGAVLYATYTVDGAYLATDLKLSWTTDAFSTQYFINRIKLWSSSLFDFSIDDMIIQNVSNSDDDWIGTSNVKPSVIPGIPPRRIYTAEATANGSINQWTPSAGSNYEAATDPTGAENVTADSYGLVDLYKFSLGASNPTDISGIVYRGSSQKYRNIRTAVKIGDDPVIVPGGFMAGGSNKYLGIIEDDGTTAWTKSSIEAAEFGQSS